MKHASIEELKPLIEELRALPRDERLKARLEIAAVRQLGPLLLELGEQCSEQPGAIAWTLMQTMNEGRRGWQLFIMNHETGQYLWHRNALTLGEIAIAVADLVEKRTIGGR